MSMDPFERYRDITIDQYFALFEGMEGSKIEYYAGHMRIDGRPFLGFALRYLVMLDAWPMPLLSSIGEPERREGCSDEEAAGHGEGDREQDGV